MQATRCKFLVIHCHRAVVDVNNEPILLLLKLISEARFVANYAISDITQNCSGKQCTFSSD